MFRFSSVLVAVLVATLVGVALAGGFGVNGQPQGTDTFTAPEPNSVGTFEISWNDGDPGVLFTDPMKFHPANGDPVKDLDGDPTLPEVTYVAPGGGATHRFTVARAGNGNVIVTYTTSVGGVQQTQEQRVYDSKGKRIP